MQVQGDAPTVPRLLEFSAWEQQVGELAWIVDAAVLERELAAALRFAPHVTVLGPRQRAGATLTALCEGKASATRAALGVEFERHDYGHTRDRGAADRVAAASRHGAAVVPLARCAGAAALRCAEPQSLVGAGLVAARERAAELLALARRGLRAGADGRPPVARPAT